MKLKQRFRDSASHRKMYTVLGNFSFRVHRRWICRRKVAPAVIFGSQQLTLATLLSTGLSTERTACVFQVVEGNDIYNSADSGFFKCL